MKSIVLLSGGMDSAVSFYWALENTIVRRVVFFDYDQNGVSHEWDAVRLLVNNACSVDKVYLRYPDTVRSSLLHHSPYEIRRRDLPHSFVPGRNLTFASVAGAIAFELGAEFVIGGWNSVDVDYPDCDAEFMNIATEAVNVSLGLGYNAIQLFSPVLDYSKETVVERGRELGVPWECTRSCYRSGAGPCLRCDSCRKRVTAFLKAGVRDPIVPDGTWDKLVCRWEIVQESGEYLEEDIWSPQLF